MLRKSFISIKNLEPDFFWWEGGGEEGGGSRGGGGGGNYSFSVKDLRIIPKGFEIDSGKTLSMRILIAS